MFCELKENKINVLLRCGRAFVNFLGHKAKEKALQLDGSSIGDWKARVKYAPEEEEEEYQVAVRYERSLYTDLANDKIL